MAAIIALQNLYEVTSKVDHMILGSIAYENVELNFEQNVKLNAVVMNELNSEVNGAYHSCIM